MIFAYTDSSTLFVGFSARSRLSRPDDNPPSGTRQPTIVGIHSNVSARAETRRNFSGNVEPSQSFERSLQIVDTARVVSRCYYAGRWASRRRDTRSLSKRFEEEAIVVNIYGTLLLGDKWLLSTLTKELVNTFGKRLLPK